MLFYANIVFLYANIMQMNKVNISIFLDKRLKKLNGKYPVKLRVYYALPKSKGTQKLYPTIFDLNESDFNSIWKTVKPRNEHKQIRKKLQALQNHAEEIANELSPFSFETFETKMFQTVNTDYSDLFTVFSEIIKQKNDFNAFSTAEKYRSAKICLQRFLGYMGKSSNKLLIETVDVDFLKGFKNYCENIIGLAPATIGIYIRNLRTVYRLAMENGAISDEHYPFGSKNFQIPSSNKVNKALTEEQLKLIWKTEPQNESQAIAKDMWFFSYFAYGMNTKDICELKHSSLNGNLFCYVRAKTKNTKKTRTEKQVPINQSLREIIERRKSIDSEYLFGILSEKDTPEQQHSKISNFNKLIVKHFRSYAKIAGIDEKLAGELGIYHARHSFATRAIRKGKSIALISEILHDGNLKVTQNYINSFPKDEYQQLSDDMDLNSMKI